MPRTSKSRIFRSTQTAPNAGTVRDLATAYGGVGNGATVASFASGGIVSSIQWTPNTTTTVATVIPSAGASATGSGWRDAVGDSATEPVRYDAGTWNLQVKVAKSGQVLATDAVVRVTVIVYFVSSTGAFITEVGRVQFADTAIGAPTLRLNGGFTTGGPYTLAAGGKIQAEAYIQPITAGVPAAPAAAVNFGFLVDEPSADNAAEFTGIPNHQIIYSRASSDVAKATDTTARSSLVTRTPGDVARAADTVTKVAGFPRATADTARASDTLARSTILARAVADVAGAADTLTRAVIVARSTADTARGADTVARSQALARATSDLARAADTLTRLVVFPRSLADTARAADTVARTLTNVRQLADTARALDTVTRVLNNVRSTTDTALAADTVTRAVTAARSTADTARSSDSLQRDVLLSRALNDTARASDTVDRLITYVRGLREQIGPGAGDFVDVPSRVLAGVVRSNTGTPVAGATVLLMRVSDDRAVQSTTSSAAGAYSFSRDKFDLHTYYVVSYLAGVPSTQGVTERGLTPVDA